LEPRELRYPLFVFFCSFYVGYLIAAVIHLWAVAIFMVFAVFTLVLFFRKTLLILVVALTLIPLGFLTGTILSVPHICSDEEYEYTGIAISDGSSGYVIAGKGYLLHEGEWKKTSTHMGILVKRSAVASTPRKGDVIWAAGKIEENVSYPYMTMRATSFGAAVEKGFSSRIGNSMKAWIIQRFEDVGLKSSSLLPVFLGEKAFVDRELADAFRGVGISHLFAVSGFHIGLMYLLLGMLFKLFMLPLKMRLYLMIILLGLYALSTGPSISSLRAFLVFSLHCMFALIDYPQHELNLLGLAGLVMIVADPGMLSSIAFQLSFGATAAILISAPLHKESTRLSFITEPLMVSVAAQIAVIPVIIINFERLSLLTIPMTLLLVPAFVLPFFVGSLAITVLGLINAETLSTILGEGLRVLSDVFEKTVYLIFEIGPEIHFSPLLASLISFLLVCSGLAFFFGMKGIARRTSTGDRLS